jgi:hypothetical protein
LLLHNIIRHSLCFCLSKKHFMGLYMSVCLMHLSSHCYNNDLGSHCCLSYHCCIFYSLG